VPARWILSIDDNADTCELLTTMLGRSGLEAVSASGVDEALRLMGGERFGLCVVDGLMSGASGLSPCEQIRAADAHAPIVIFSGHAAEGDIEAGMSAGADAYVVKHDLTELISTVKRLLSEVAA
jgi:CheY-like chemotaxis protein